MYFNWYVRTSLQGGHAYSVTAMVTQVCATIRREQADTEEKCERT